MVAEELNRLDERFRLYEDGYALMHGSNVVISNAFTVRRKF